MEVSVCHESRTSTRTRISVADRVQYCTSGDLGTLIRKAQRTNAPLNEDKIWNIFLQITQALHHCHWPNERTPAQNGKLGARLSGAGEDGGKGRCQVLHRDLKPENGESDLFHCITWRVRRTMLIQAVFLSDDFVKLGDFGLSKDMGSAAFTSTYVGVSSLHILPKPQLREENRAHTQRHRYTCLQRS